MADNWCVTDYPTSSFSYQWTIKSFKHWCTQNSDNPLKSPTFSGNAPGHDDTFKWHLKVKLYYSGTYVSLFIVLEQNLDFKVWAKYKFSILINGEENSKHTKVTDSPSHFSVGAEVGYNSFIDKKFLLDKANGLLLDDTLTLYCEVTVYLLNNPVERTGSKHQIIVPAFDVGCKLGSALKEKYFSDVTLAVGKKEFKAHKVILAVQSPVFRAMFESEMMESKSNRVEIDDIDQESMEEMLTFIYTGKAPKVGQMAHKLLLPADKYQLDHLKLMCEEVLCRDVKVENVVDVLVLADKYSANQLKTICLKFIATHASETMQTQSWESLKPAQEYHSLVTEVFEATLGMRCMQLQ